MSCRARKINMDDILLKKIKALEKNNSRLSSLINVSREIMKEMRLEPLFRLIMKKVTHVMDAERSSLFLLDRKTDELYALVAQGTEGGVIRFPNGKGVAGTVGKTGETINIKDAYHDPRFNRDFDTKTGFRTKSMLCEPIMNSRREILGVMQILNKKGSEPYFTEDDESLLAAFTSIVAISLENSFAYETINRTMTAFEKFVPRRYLDSLSKDGLESLKVGRAEQVNVSVLFCDIRDFTRVSEKMEPSETLSFLNDFLNRMSAVINRNGGFIDKFIGDAIMAVFEKSNTEDVVQSAIDMMQALQKLNRERKKEGKEPVQIGIGIHYGPALLGTVGSADRMDSTIIGDSVNLAARTEGLTKQFGCPVIITESVVSHLGKNKNKYNYRMIDTVRVKGRDKPVKIYDLYNFDATGIIKKKRETTDLLEKGRKLYIKQKWKEALDCFSEGHRLNLKDPIFKIYINRCKLYMSGEERLPELWDGSFSATEK